MQLVGQEKIKQFIDKLTPQNCPHFMILSGGRMCGKTTVTQMLADKINAMKTEFQPSVDSVRQIISTIYSIKEPCVYWCEDLDKMHVSGKNALLKVTEETPKNAYIVLHSSKPLMATLKSRAQVIEFEPYSFKDYEEYCKLNDIEMPENAEVLMMSCNSLAEFAYHIQTGSYKEAYELANKVLDYIGEVSKVNAFKILTKLSLKKDAEGIDPIFFLTVLLNSYIFRKGNVEFGDIIVKSSQEALQSLRQDVFSKSAIMDKWLLEIMRGIDEIC